MGKQDHKCFGCGKQIESHDPHIHVGLDEWAAKEGAGDPLGLDDLLTFAFCEPCTQKTERGWDLESHEVSDA